jgi:hypothetical protein
VDWLLHSVRRLIPRTTTKKNILMDEELKNGHSIIPNAHWSI